MEGPCFSFSLGVEPANGFEDGAQVARHWASCVISKEAIETNPEYSLEQIAAKLMQHLKVIIEKKGWPGSLEGVKH